MSIKRTCIEKQVKAFCAHIGADPLLVQGAGGNVSWKDGSTLWVKASGTWLAEAQLKDIFVPVDLSLLQTALFKQDFSVNPEVISGSDLRPSIETLLHALMPHKVVAHLHAIEILAHLVQVNAKEKIKYLVGDSVKWIYVDYFKPGADLARAISRKLAKNPDADVVFLGNHGVVIGGETIDDVNSTLSILLSILQTTTLQSLPVSSPLKLEPEFFVRGYIHCGDEEVSLLAKNNELTNRLRHDWALYPDHVVFLGGKSALLEANFCLVELDEITNGNPPFIFSISETVYESVNATEAQKCQLRCYYEVLIRQTRSAVLSSLTDEDVTDLIDWDFEKFRKNLSL
jgi:rhamnose utilization protein RhaD (predicted bifunctional aldolase and dehydrogenase)